MANSSKPIGTIVASVCITLLISGLGIYFGLPLVYPNLKAEEEGLVVQTKHQEFYGQDYLSNTDTTIRKIKDTEINITTQGNTKLWVSFDMLVLLNLDNVFSGSTRYNITLSVEGIQNKTTHVIHLNQAPIGDYWEETQIIHLNMETEVLPAGEYTVATYWHSVYTLATGTAYLITGITSYNESRSLSIQEIKV